MNDPATMRKPIPPMLAAPTLSDHHGKAWRFDLDAIRQRMNVAADSDAAVDAWLVEAPWAHPLWHSYLILLIHLRPITGFEPPILYHPHATHEIHVHALDPEGDRDRLLVESMGWHCRTLEPPNYTGQIVEVTDDLARDRIRKAVERICRGDLSPDTDYRAQWIALFGDNMIRDRAR